MRRVIKLGGSLLTLPNLAQHLRAWLAEQPPAQNVLIVGGGERVEAVRAIDRINPLDEQVAHWLCIRAMSVNAALVASLLPEAALVNRLEAISTGDRGRPVILDVLDVLTHEEPFAPGPRLPESWDVTSDSIAARIATMLGVGELVLLKSALPPIGSDRVSAADVAYVDRLFARFAVDLPIVRCVDLRNASLPVGMLLPGPSGGTG